MALLKALTSSEILKLYYLLIDSHLEGTCEKSGRQKNKEKQRKHEDWEQSFKF